MPAATAEEAIRYRAQVDELKRQYSAGLLRCGLVSLAAGNFSPAGSLYQALTGNGLAADVEATRVELLSLERVSLPRVLSGQRENGTEYNAQLFHIAVEQVGRRIQGLTGEAWNSSLFGALTYAPHDALQVGKEAVRSVAGAAREAMAPFVPDEETLGSLLFWGKVAVGGAVAAGVVGAVARLVRGR